jgi:hypothetical protein
MYRIITILCIYLPFFLKGRLHDGKISTSYREQTKWLERSVALTRGIWSVYTTNFLCSSCNSLYYLCRIITFRWSHSHFDLNQILKRLLGTPLLLSFALSYVIRRLGFEVSHPFDFYFPLPFYFEVN